MSLFGALGPLGEVAGQKAKWLGEAIAYTLAGIVTSGAVGAGLGLLGGLVLSGPLNALKSLFVLTVGGLAIARELRWIRLPLPQWKRQTKDYWAKIYPGPVAATLWGLDLGLTLTTRLTFSGVWVLVALAIVVGDTRFGAGLLMAYWLGRALSVWIAPLLMPNALSTPWVLDVISGQSRLFRRTHVAGLVWVIVVLAAVFSGHTKV